MQLPRVFHFHCYEHKSIYQSLFICRCMADSIEFCVYVFCHLFPYFGYVCDSFKKKVPSNLCSSTFPPFSLIIILSAPIFIWFCFANRWNTNHLFPFIKFKKYNWTIFAKLFVCAYFIWVDERRFAHLFIILYFYVALLVPVLLAHSLHPFRSNWKKKSWWNFQHKQKVSLVCVVDSILFSLCQLPSDSQVFFLLIPYLFHPHNEFYDQTNMFMCSFILSHLPYLASDLQCSQWHQNYRE